MRRSQRQGHTDGTTRVRLSTAELSGQPSISDRDWSRLADPETLTPAALGEIESHVATAAAAIRAAAFARAGLVRDDRDD